MNYFKRSRVFHNDADPDPDPGKYRIRILSPYIKLSKIQFRQNNFFSLILSVIGCLYLA